MKGQLPLFSLEKGDFVLKMAKNLLFLTEFIDKPD